MMQTKATVVLAAMLLSASFMSAAQPGLSTEEFIYESAPFPSCHAATLAETSEGLIAAFFGGTRERDPDVCIYVSRHVNGRWTPPQEVANGVGFTTNRLPTWNPVLFQPAIARGRLYAPTSRGNLFCIETGDPADDGWLMWGATAAHNGLAE